MKSGAGGIVGMASSAIFEGISPENQRRIGPILIRMDEFIGFLVPLYLEMTPIQQEKARRQLILVLDRQSPKNLFRLHLFLRLMSWWPRLRHQRSFRRLPSPQGLLHSHLLRLPLTHFSQRLLGRKHIG